MDSKGVLIDEQFKLATPKNNAFARGTGNIFPIYPERALNAEIRDVEGKRYIDFAGGIAGARAPLTIPMDRLDEGLSTLTKSFKACE